MVSSVRSPHPGASTGTATSLEPSEIGCSFWTNPEPPALGLSWGIEALQLQKFLTLCASVRPASPLEILSYGLGLPRSSQNVTILCLLTDEPSLWPLGREEAEKAVLSQKELSEEKGRVGLLTKVPGSREKLKRERGKSLKPLKGCSWGRVQMSWFLHCQASQNNNISNNNGMHNQLPTHRADT